jgi:DHA2 family multidrug resistance protein-like MFS transporter
MEISTARKWATLVVGCLAALMPGIDMTALNLAIPNLNHDLHPSGSQILWISDAYGFVLAGLLITMGYLGDRIGRKKLLLVGVAAFGAVSLLAAYAGSAEQLILARGLLGVAGATIMPSTLSLVRNVFTDPKQRTSAIGIFSGVGAAGIGLGPILGGVLLDHFWWGAVFVINLPVMAALFVVGLVLLPESRNPRPGRIDLLSVPLSIVGMLGLVYAIQQSVYDGVTEPRVLAAGVVGVLALVLFGWRQARLAHPLIDVRLFRRAAFSGSIGANTFAMFALVAQSLIFSQYFQLVLGYAPLRAGLAGLPGSVSAMAGGMLAAPLIGALGRARVVAAGLAVAAAGTALYALAGVHSDYLVLLAAMVPAALGMGMALTVLADTILASVPRERAGAASAISETATELGGALGIAVLGTVLNSAYRHGIELPAGLPAPAVAGVRNSLGAALDVAAGLPARLGGEVVTAARQAFVDGMHVATLCSAGLALAVGLAALVTLRRVPKVIPEHIEPADGETDGELVGAGR